MRVLQPGTGMLCISTLVSAREVIARAPPLVASALFQIRKAQRSRAALGLVTHREYGAPQKSCNNAVIYRSAARAVVTDAARKK